MRLLNALKTDIIFQYRQGFYWIYLLITLVYMTIMSKLPEGNIKAVGVMLAVFSDPSMLGFFFIGGIVMMEKVQGVIKYLGVTPVYAWEYLLAKALSLSLVSLAAGSLITKVTYKGEVRFGLLLLGILLSSVFFTLYGFLIAAWARTINQYFIKMVPFMVLIALPCFSFLLKEQSVLFDLFPSVAGLRLIQGAFFGIPSSRALLNVFILLVETGIILILAKDTYIKMLVSEEE